MMTSVAVVTIAAVQLVSAGFCLGTGFWLSKKFTGVIDEKLLMYDERKLQQLKQEMELTHD
jgi:hypothetical protein